MSAVGRSPDADREKTRSVQLYARMSRLFMISPKLRSFLSLDVEFSVSRSMKYTASTRRRACYVLFFASAAAAVDVLPAFFAASRRSASRRRRANETHKRAITRLRYPVVAELPTSQKSTLTGTGHGTEELALTHALTYNHLNVHVADDLRSASKI